MSGVLAVGLDDDDGDSIATPELPPLSDSAAIFRRERK